jgi:hypothetical protein
LDTFAIWRLYLKSFVCKEKVLFVVKLIKMQESVSVYQLITRLCDCLIKESECEVEGFTVRNARSTAFNVLLKSNCEQVPDDEKLTQELQFASFELSLASRNRDSKHVNQFIEILNGNQSEINSSCWLLLHLKNIDPDPEKATLKVIISRTDC